MKCLIFVCFSSLLLSSAYAASILDVGFQLTLDQPIAEWRNDLVVNATCSGTCYSCSECSSFDFTISGRNNKTYTISKAAEYNDLKFYPIVNLTKYYENQCSVQQTVSITNLKLNESGKIMCTSPTRTKTGIAFLYLFRSVGFTNTTLPTKTELKTVDVETTGGKLTVTKREFNKTVDGNNFPFISCSFESTTSNVAVHWSWANSTQFSADQDFGTVEAGTLSGNQRISKFVFTKFADKAASIIGQYKCVIEKNATFFPSVFAAPVVSMSEKDYRSSMESDVMTQSCTIAAYPSAVITWTKDNETIVADGTRILLTANNSTLTIKELKKTDAGLYVCTAENQLGIGQAHIKLRVKDRLAALWPFLGIVAEVLILVTIILLYERKRSSQKRSQEEQENAEVNKDQEPAAKDDSDVRHRPVKT